MPPFLNPDLYRIPPCPSGCVEGEMRENSGFMSGGNRVGLIRQKQKQQWLPAILLHKKKGLFHWRKQPFFREKLPNVPGFSEARHKFQ
jgi:hypothetical protein